MKFSVIIPAYCAEKTIENTVNSILKSGIHDFEIVIVDDGSKDNTPAICDRLSEIYKNVRCIHQENAGVSAARNRGLSEANGDYVWFFDADDSVDENSMTHAVKIIEEKAPDMLIFGMSFDFYRNGAMYRRDELTYQTEALYTKESVKAVFEDLYKCNALTSSWNKVIRKNILTDNKLCFNESMVIMEDFLFVSEVMQFCESIYTLPQTIYRYHNLSVKSVKEEPSNKRLERVPCLSKYLVPFETSLKEQKKTLASLYYMLLGQKLRTQKPAEIAITADDFCNGPYSKGELYNYCPNGMKKTAELLKRRKCVRIFLRQLIKRTRNKAVGLIKRTNIYKKIRG